MEEGSPRGLDVSAQCIECRTPFQVLLENLDALRALAQRWEDHPILCPACDARRPDGASSDGGGDGRGASNANRRLQDT